jgi:hypothetical protein
MTTWVILIVYNSGHIDRREFTGELSTFLSSLDEEDIRQFSAEPKKVEPSCQPKRSAIDEDVDE